MPLHGMNKRLNLSPPCAGSTARMVSKWIFRVGAGRGSFRKMRRAHHLLSLILALLLASNGNGAEQPQQPVITEAKELHRLTRAEMLAPRKVRIKGII